MEPYRDAAFLAKLDDDSFINVPELVAHLKLLRHRPMVLYGIFYYASWDLADYSVAVAGYSAHVRLPVKCNCSKAFPFAAAPAQVLSTDLATALASSLVVQEYVQAPFVNPLRNFSRKAAAEDAFIGGVNPPCCVSAP